MKKRSFFSLFNLHQVLFWLAIVVVGILIGLTFVFLIPTTSVYKNMVKDVWAVGHPEAAFYLNRADSTLAMEIGNYYFGGGGYDLHKATASYTLALKLQPGIQGAEYQLARIYFVEGNFDQALVAINEELKTNPSNLRSLYVRGLIDMSQNDLAQAEQDFKNFVQWEPGEWGGYNDLAFVLAEEGKYVESETIAKQAFTKVMNANQVPWLFNSLGIAELNLGQYTEARDSFMKALALAETITPTEWHRAYSGNDPASITESITAFQDAVEKNLNVAESHIHTQ